MREPKRYQDLLEFLYLCFSLGFRGRYKVAAQDQGEFEQIYTACTTFCINFAATRLFLYYIRTRKPRADATS
ncbi:Aec26 [Salmonella enterica subsp. enterica serovar Sanjuan]|uniref:Aec26 n=1 Tax=Salmonella enterica subsp. enterica serovar Sanjuan TaxID=1160765 RepID=A0A3S4GTL5_SALET|nr:Aec26 [Salmonella enterica subsp. enterica serovar Sanjuan]